MNDHRWHALLAILIILVSQTSFGQQSTTLHATERAIEQTAGDKVKYRISVVTGTDREAITPGPVSFELKGSNGGALQHQLGRMDIGTTTPFELSGTNIGYPCNITLTAGTGDGWQAQTVTVDYVVDGNPNGSNRTPVIGWIDKDGCGNNAGPNCASRTLQLDPEAVLCKAEVRSAAIESERKASLPVITLGKPGYGWNQDIGLLSFSVKADISKAQGKSAKLVLAFTMRRGAEVVPLSPRPDFADSTGHEVIVEQVVTIATDPQTVTFSNLQVPWGGFNQLTSGGPYAIRVEASLYLDGTKVEASGAREFDYPPQ